jgi:diguanylate cyclase (GGDEF)-like protein
VQPSEVSVSQQAIDQFLPERFALKIVPLTLAAAGASTALFSAAAFFTGGRASELRNAIGIAAAVIMLMAAYGCGYYARRGRIAGATVSTLGFAMVASTAGSWTAYLSDRGAIFTLHVSMMLLVIGAIIAPRFVFVVTSWFIIAGPVVFFILIDQTDVPEEARILVGFLLTMVVVTSLLYLLVSRVKQSYFRLLSDSYQRSRTDPLTGLYNRNAWMELVTIQTASKSSRSPAQAVILYMDVDNLKQVNDQRGHHAGDRLLTTVADILSASLAPSAILARFGGDEYVAFLPGETRDSMSGALEQVRATIARDPACIGASLSIGMTVFEGIGSVEDALNRADADLLNIKRNRRSTRALQTTSGLSVEMALTPAD